jgi:hypothetical protein
MLAEARDGGVADTACCPIHDAESRPVATQAAKFGRQ